MNQKEFAERQVNKFCRSNDRLPASNAETTIAFIKYNIDYHDHVRIYSDCLHPAIWDDPELIRTIQTALYNKKEILKIDILVRDVSNLSERDILKAFVYDKKYVRIRKATGTYADVNTKQFMVFSSEESNKIAWWFQVNPELNAAIANFNDDINSIDFINIFDTAFDMAEEINLL